MPETYFMPAVTVLRRGGVRDAGKWAHKLAGTKALVVASDNAIGKEQGQMVASILYTYGIDSVVYSSVAPNPTDAMVHEGVALYRSEKCDILVAIGGGSAIDCAKAIGLLVNNGGRIGDYKGVNVAAKSLPPFIAITTTAGTGSEVTQFTIISSAASHEKMAIVDWHTTANVAINDPELMISMPPALTAASGMDALSHAIEAYLCIRRGPLSDGLSREAISIISRWLPTAVENGKNLDAREMMCHASYLAGVAFNNSGLGYVHAMSHPISGMYGSAHGVVNAILMPHVERFNLPVCAERLSDVARAMNIAVRWHSDNENGEKVLAALEKLTKRLNMPTRLRDIGVRRGDISQLAAMALKDATAAGNPRRATVGTIEQIYREAY